MERIFMWLLNYGMVIAVELTTSTTEDTKSSHSDQAYFYLPPPDSPPPTSSCYPYGHLTHPHICLLPPPVQKVNFHTATPYSSPSSSENSLLAALLLSASLGLQPKTPGYNHLEHLPLNPYLALLLSHYGKYSPIHGTGRGIYGYTAANNYHNNKPFGAYKVYDDDNDN